MDFWVFNPNVTFDLLYDSLSGKGESKRAIENLSIISQYGATPTKCTYKKIFIRSVEYIENYTEFSFFNRGLLPPGFVIFIDSGLEF